MTRTACFPFTILLLVMAAGCNSTTPTAPSARPSKEFRTVVELTPAQQQQKQAAIAAKDKLFAALFAELTSSMAEDGPAKSIEVCKSRAPELARAVSEESGVQIGRTSFQLRNPENRPPNWAVDFVQDRIAEPQHVALPDDGLGVLLPIPLKDTCLQCHGNDEQILPEVKDAILALYPGDAATDFAEGDLRGYFWVEVPRQ